MAGDKTHTLAPNAGKPMAPPVTVPGPPLIACAATPLPGAALPQASTDGSGRSRRFLSRESGSQGPA